MESFTRKRLFSCNFSAWKCNDDDISENSQSNVSMKCLQTRVNNTRLNFKLNITFGRTEQKSRSIRHFFVQMFFQGLGIGTNPVWVDCVKKDQNSFSFSFFNRQLLFVWESEAKQSLEFHWKERKDYFWRN